MPEYITKNAAINTIENTPIELFQSEWEEIEEAINTAPAADVVPVVHGKWIKRGYVCGDDEWECSACHETEWRGLSEADVMRFCMFCGARMDGGADND